MAFDKSKYYIGRIYNPESETITDEPVLLNPSNLLTHGVVVGMTGSGKTGLCICLLEEAALHNTPAIIIDPKGDLTNLVLHFPKQQPSDFEPWINTSGTERDGKTAPELAQEIAQEIASTWKKGLADWGIGEKELQELKDSADFAIYTPGSSSGLKINVLSMLEKPNFPEEITSEELSDRVSSTVSALLTMIGFENADPIHSREHILLSTLLLNSWRKNEPLLLEELIPQVQNPPVEKIGAIPIDMFFPEKDRFSFSMMLNNFLASPSFSIWREGQVLDIDYLMNTQSKPRHSIFCLSHLTEKERMFFVTLLLTSIEGWMRRQEGTSSLKGIVYIDEIIGYVPPVANPPSKNVILRLYKQARAYGLGLLLATQNPVDFDYKALSNAGTWIIGRLQTEQDKNRLVDGLSSSSGTIDISLINRLISSLPKRVFMMHSIYNSSPILLHSRWAMNYLPGPIDKSKIRKANELAGALDVSTIELERKTSTGISDTDNQVTSKLPSTLTTSRPAIPGNIDEYVMPIDSEKSDSGIIYRAGIIAQSEVLYVSKQHNLEHKEKRCAIIEDIGGGLIHWEDIVRPGIDSRILTSSTIANALYEQIHNWLADVNKQSEIQKDFKEWIYRNGSLTLKANVKLKVFSSPESSNDDFIDKCYDVVQKKIDGEILKASSSYDTKINSLQNKIELQELEVKAVESSVSQRRLETLATGGSVVIGMLSGRKRSITSTLTKNRLATAAKDRLIAEQETLRNYKEQLVVLLKSKENVVQQVKENWNSIAEDISEITLRPIKSNVFIEFFGVVWLPYQTIEKEGKKIQIQAFKLSN